MERIYLVNQGITVPLKYSPDTNILILFVMINVNKRIVSLFCHLYYQQTVLVIVKGVASFKQ